MGRRRYSVLNTRMLCLCVFVTALKDNAQVIVGVRVSPGCVSRLEPILSDGFLQEMRTSRAWGVCKCGSKNRAQPGALHRNCGRCLLCS